jgi:sterol desaturase/sphingolipid hydroxylase (fatty acid hydroxylase superfamily)
MPSPIDLLLDPISLTVFALYAALITWESIAPARPLPRVNGWKALGLGAFAVYFFLSSYLPLIWTEHLAPFQLFDLTSLGTWMGAAVGLLVYEAGVYFWHRRMHGSDVLWRVFHQMHHSAERLDTYGAFWFSPADMVGWTVLSSLCLTLLVELDARSGDRRAARDDAAGDLPEQQNPYTALARLHRTTPGKPFASPRARSPLRQLLRPADLRHLV